MEYVVLYFDFSVSEILCSSAGGLKSHQIMEKSSSITYFLTKFILCVKIW